MRRGLVTTVVALTAAVLVASCSSSSTPPAAGNATPTTGATATTATTGAMATTTTAVSTGSFDSCSVVTQAEAASALGASVTPGVLGNATVEGGLACVFYGPAAPTPTTPNSAQPDSVRVVVVQGPDATTWYDDYRSKVDAQPISGYGDEAYYDGYASLSVLKGDYYLRIAVSPAGAPPSLADEEQLADAILPRL